MDSESRPPIFAGSAADAAPVSTPKKPSSTAATATAATPTPTPSSTDGLRQDSGVKKASKRGLRGQLAVLDNVAEMLTEMVCAAESKDDVASNDIIAEMVWGVPVSMALHS